MRVKFWWPIVKRMSCFENEKKKIPVVEAETQYLGINICVYPPSSTTMFPLTWVDKSYWLKKAELNFCLLNLVES